MNDNSIYGLHRLMWTALFAAAIAVGAFIQFPLGGVPVTLQTVFVLLAGFVLGPFYAVAAVAVYILAGFVGLPVFSGGHSGIGHIFGPTGGYLIGFLFAAFIAGLARFKGQKASWPVLAGCGFLALIPVYGIGVPWLKMTIDVSWPKALAIGCYPFLPGAFIKTGLAVLIAILLRRRRIGPR